MSTKPRLGRNVIALSVVSLLTDVSSEMIYPLLPLFLTTTLGASATMLGVIEGAAESTSALLKLASGWWSDRVSRRKPLVVVGYAIATIARPLVAIAQSATQVLAIRLGDRVGKGIRTSPRDALIADSVDESIRGKAFGFHRAMDHAGAFAGPLVAFALINVFAMRLRTVFWIAAIPGALSVLVLVAFVREKAVAPTAASTTKLETRGLSRRFWAYLGIVFVFTLGSSTDAFLLLRAHDLGVPVAMMGVLWAVHSAAKSLLSTPGGALSDRFGRVPTMIAGWLIYAAVYVGFAAASEQWQAWLLFIAYGLFFGLTEGSEKALVADLVEKGRRGAAYGWYNLTIGLAALPASLVFGLVWDAYGASIAFVLGALIAAVASLALLVFASNVKPLTSNGR